jgi:hypothetical protein
MEFLKLNSSTMATFVLAISIGGCSSQSKEAGTSASDKLKCQKQLSSAAYCVFQYRSDHDERFPKILEEAVSGEAGIEVARRFIQCPVNSPTAKYTYIDWSRWFTNLDVPKYYPLVYESNRRQHGDGINVALMDGSAFWDEGARWISDFAKKHPEYRLEIPK